jgi:uncharacterized protein
MPEPAAGSWRDSVIAYIRAEALPIDKYGHQPRLYALAVQLGQATQTPFDDDILFASAWMHDLGVFLGHRPKDPVELARWDHVPYTIARSRELLASWGFPPEKLEGVAETIRTHQPKDQPTAIEGTLLRDADILEQLGAVGLARALAKIGRDSRFPTFSAVLPVLRNAADQLPLKLQLKYSKKLAQPRVKLLRKVISALDAEGGRLLY